MARGTARFEAHPKYANNYNGGQIGVGFVSLVRWMQEGMARGSEEIEAEIAYHTGAHPRQVLTKLSYWKTNSKPEISHICLRGCTRWEMAIGKSWRCRPGAEV